MKIVEWEEFYKICKDYIDLVIDVAQDEIAISRYPQEKFEFYKDCLDRVFTMMEECWYYIKSTPDFHNIETTEEDRQKWKDDSEVCTFEGMWDFFGYRLPVYCDDYGQQMYVKFEKLNGEIVDVTNGTYCISTDNVAYQLLSYIKEDIIERLKDYIKRASGIELK